METTSLNELLKKRLGNTEEDSSDDNRNPYFRDYGRVIHSTAFRRLQGKTQIYPGHHSVIRTRLTHSLEVSEIAESIYYQYFKDEELIDLAALRTICLIHDIGHPPFGHKGDKALNAIIKDKYGDNHFFEGNAQNFRIVNKLSQRQRGKYGQNLTIRVLLGIIKKFKKKKNEESLDIPFKDNIYREDYHYVKEIEKLLDVKDLLDKQVRTIECAIMDRADEIAYVTHDLDDAIQNGKFTIEEVIKFIQKHVYDNDNGEGKKTLTTFLKQMKEYNEITSPEEKRQKVIHALINLLITNIDVPKKKLGHIKTIDDYLVSGIEFEFKNDIEALRNALYNEFIYKKFIKTPQVQLYEQKACRVIKEVFEEINSNTKLLPQKYQEMIEKENNLQARIIVDYIAGMTDPFFTEIYNRLFTFQKHNINDEL